MTLPELIAIAGAASAAVAGVVGTARMPFEVPTEAFRVFGGTRRRLGRLRTRR